MSPTPRSNERQPLSPPIELSSVYQCETPAEASALLAGEQAGYVYSRDGHPNSDELASACAAWHGADDAMVTGSGMSALALALLSRLAPGDHVVASTQLYGQSLRLFAEEGPRWGISCSTVDTCDLKATAAALQENTMLLVVETIANPMLRVADIGGLAALCQRRDVALLVDNTFASPAICKPLALGATLVMESLTKIMNGHSDVMLGLLAGGENHDWPRTRQLHSLWGLMASPFDCWLAARGLTTLPLRAAAASENAQQVALYLRQQGEVSAVHYPGLTDHPDHELALRQFEGRCGSMVTFELAPLKSMTDRDLATRFVQAANQIGIPFCPSLGETRTTLSHPASTSHRRLDPNSLSDLGINERTIRLSLGIEPTDELLGKMAEILARLDA